MDQLSDRSCEDAVLCYNRNEGVVAVVVSGVGREWEEDWKFWQLGRLFKDVEDERLSGQDGGRLISAQIHCNNSLGLRSGLLHLVRERLRSWLRAARIAPAPKNTITSLPRASLFWSFSSVH